MNADAAIEKKYKDIDEFLRDIEEPERAYFDLIDNAVDGIQFQIECLPECNESIKISRLLEPVFERIARINDDLLVEGYLEIIKQKYPKSGLRTAYKKRIERMRSDWQLKQSSQKDIPKDDFGLIVHNNCYFKKSHEGSTIKIAEFVIKLRKIFVIDDELHYECILKNNKNEPSSPIIFSPDDRAGLQSFRLKCVSQGSYYFYGSQAEVYRIWQYEESQANIKEVVLYVQKYGYLEEHRVWLFENCAIRNGKIYEINADGIIKIDNKGFKAKDVLVYSGDTPTIDYSAIDGGFKNEVLEKFLQMIDGHNGNRKPETGDRSFKAFLALGFVAAAVYVHEIVEVFKCFPFFFPYGPSNTGKSASTGLLLNFFGFDGRSEPWESATPDGTFKFMEQLSCVPAWYDEFKNSSDRRFEKMLGILKNVYNRIGAGKGGIKKRQINKVDGCLWLSGEDCPMDKGLLSRCVVLRFTEITDFKTEAYNWLIANQSKLTTILVDLIRNKTKDSAKNLINYIKSIQEYLAENGVGDNRTIINYSIAAGAFSLFDYHKQDEAFLNYVVEEAKMDKVRKEDEDILVSFFADLSYMVNKGLTRNNTIVDPVDNILYFCFNEVYSDWIILLRNRGTLQIFKKNTILDYIKHKEYYVELEENRVRIGDKRKRVIAVNLNKMSGEIREYFEKNPKDDWPGEEPGF